MGKSVGCHITLVIGQFNRLSLSITSVRVAFAFTNSFFIAH